MTLEPEAAGTRVRLDGHTEIVGLLKALDRLFVRMGEKTDGQNLATARRILSGPLPLVFSRSVERLHRGTWVTFAYDVTEPGLLLRVFGTLVRRMGRRQLEGDVQRLKMRLGATPPSHG